VVLSGKQKAAMLLMSLDAPTAAELLKGIDAETVQELAVEVAYLDVSGCHNAVQGMEVARLFYHSLEKDEGFHLQDFLGTMLKSTVGQEKAQRIQTQIQDLLQQRDPFISIRLADPKVLAAILAREHPQAIAVVLAELAPRKSSEVLGLLPDTVRLEVVTRMTAREAVHPEAKIRIAQMVCSQLQAPAAGTEAAQDQSMRKVAVMLRNLSKEIRDGLMSSITQKDAEAAEAVSRLMVLWEDIPEVADRSLQQALREVDSQKLAMALINADETVAAKIKSNISERAAATIEEETSLMSAPRKADIEEARENVVGVLREMNEKGELNFSEE
jgi:flagellar motor switch protein FliG